MLSMLLAAQLLAAVPQHDSYSSPSLRDLVERASARNHATPAGLDAYRADVESEIAVLLRRAAGEEVMVSVEQAHNEIQWQRSGDFSQHVTGYRGKLSGPSISALAVMNKAWVIPTLYGNRLALFFGQDASTGKLREGDAPAGPRSVLAVHPFAAGRERVYEFSGGDTIAVIKTADRTVTVARLFVQPKAEQVDWPVVVFRGEINLDAATGEIVRMRGQFITLARNGPQRQRALVVPVSVKAYVDLESVLVDGRYWLPRQQRIEQHVDIGGLAEGRSVFRIVSRFVDHRIFESSAGDVSLMLEEGTEFTRVSRPATIPVARVHRLTMAPTDSLGRPREWLRPLGEMTADLRGDDFADVGAGAMASSAPFAWRVQRLADLVHFNRVEGWATGAAVMSNVGSLELRGNASWAWTEQTVRGRVEAIRTSESGNRKAGLRVGRTLDITNDFTTPYDSGGSIMEALAGVDRYDYVDRRAATAWIRVVDTPERAFHAELGFVREAGAQARLTRGLWELDTPFLPNRGVDAGRYVRASAQGDWNPAVNADPMVAGLGMSARYEAAAGQLSWQKATARFTARKDVGPFLVGARLDAGAVIGDSIPPQQLLEVGGEPTLPGYLYKEFAGDRAVVVQWRAGYRLPVMRSPLRLMGCTCLPAPAPALMLTLHGANVWASRATTMASITRLGAASDRIGMPPAAPGTTAPVSWPTAGWRGAMEIGFRFFGGAASLGAVRVNEAGASWRPRFTLGTTW